MELKNAALLGFYDPRMNCQESSKWFRMRLATGNKTKTKTLIEEPSTPMDFWHRILAREPLTLRWNASEVDLIIDFENNCFSQFEANNHLD
jgi:hypothetical protein